MILSEEPQWSAEERTATWLHKTRGYLQQQRPPTHQPLPVCPQSTVTETPPTAESPRRGQASPPVLRPLYENIARAPKNKHRLVKNHEVTPVTAPAPPPLPPRALRPSPQSTTNVSFALGKAYYNDRSYVPIADLDNRVI